MKVKKTCFSEQPVPLKQIAFIMAVILDLVLWYFFPKEKASQFSDFSRNFRGIWKIWKSVFLSHCVEEPSRKLPLFKNL